MKEQQPAASGGSSPEDETERLPLPPAAEGTANPAALRSGQVLVDRYVVAEPIGRGGGCLVYRAFDKGLNEWIAIKVLDPERWPGAAITEPLFRELRHAREILHPHVCRLYDVVRAERAGSQFLTMALAPGGSLRDTLARSPDRPFAERLSDMEGVLSGLAALHAAGIIHRDVKPENVLRMGDGRVVLSDFGLAVAPDRATHVTGGVGTPVYMAPELRLGAPADARADVWSLGLLMHEILFGVRAQDAIPLRIASTPRERRLQQRLKALCRWCLETDPDRRPVDAGAVLRAFRRVTEGGWLGIGPPGRRPWPIALALTAAAAGVTALAFRSEPHKTPPTSITEVRLERQARSLADRTRLLAQVDGRVHCLSRLPDGSLGMIWGEPRRAEKLDPRSGAREPWAVPPRSYELPPTDLPDPVDNKCPQMGPDGKRLLYWGVGAGNQRAVFLQEDVDASPTLLTAGSMPVWHPKGELLALRVDDHHPGLFDLQSGHLTVLPKPRDDMLVLSQLAFDTGGRHLLVRSVDGAVGYAVSRYDLERLPRVEGVLVRRALDAPEHIVRLTIGASLPSGDVVHAMMPGGAYGIAAINWDAPHVRWVGELQPLDITSSLATAETGLVLLARRWTSDLEVLRNGEVVRTVVADHPVGASGANARGDVVAQVDRGGRIMVLLYRAGERQPRVLGSGPVDGGPSFSPDGRSVLFARSDTSLGLDYVMLCSLDGACRQVGSVPNSSDYLRLSPSGDQVAYIGWTPYPHVRMLDLRNGASRVLVVGLPCAPRWLGPNLWIAKGSSEEFSWVELEPATGRATGRKVPGRTGCGAAGSGPDGVLEQRLRVFHRENSRLLALEGELL
jgi:hypothetical protein